MQNNKDAPRFPLSFAAPLLQEEPAFAGSFDAAGKWRQRWTVHTLVGRPAMADGRLVMVRTPIGKAEFRLAVVEYKVSPNGDASASFDFQCRADALGQPVKWTVSAQAPVAGSYRHSLRQQPSGTAHSNNWCLFEAVQRLPRDAGLKIPFTLVTPEGATYENQELRYGGEREIAWGGQPVRLHEFQKTGPGDLPWCYFVTPEGRLAIAVSGLQAWVLRKEEEKA